MQVFSKVAGTEVTTLRRRIFFFRDMGCKKKRGFVLDRLYGGKITNDDVWVTVDAIYALTVLP